MAGEHENSRYRLAPPLRGPGLLQVRARALIPFGDCYAALRIPVASVPPTPSAAAPLRRPGGN